MNKLRARTLKVLHEAIGERQVEIAGAKEIAYRDRRLPCGRVDARARRTDEQVVVAQLAKCIDQVNDLLRPPIKMAPGFDMQYFHRLRILLQERARARSCNK